MIPPRAWLALALGDNRSRASNDGYDDEISSRYCWDSTVPQHAALRPGDYIVLWDSTGLLGMSVIEQITVENEQVKQVYRCPRCQSAKIHVRRDGTYRCSAKHWDEDAKTNSICGEFDTPVSKTIQVTTYATQHKKEWKAMPDGLTAAELRACCEAPKSQHSLRPVKIHELEALLQSRGYGLPMNEMQSDLPRTLPSSGHRLAMTAQRLGQAEFRKQMLLEFGDVCAVTGKCPRSVLEACHLYSYASAAVHHPHGGLLLRRDIHALFDAGLITFQPPSYRVHVSKMLRNFPMYAQLHHQPLQVPLKKSHQEWILLHWEQHHQGKHATATLD